MQPIYWNGCAVYFAWIFIYHFSIYPNIVNDSLSYQWSFGNLTDVTLVDEDGYSMQVDDLYYGNVVVDSFDKFNRMRQLLPAADNFNQLPKSLTAFTSCRHPCLTYHLNLSYRTKLKKPNLPDRIDHSWALNWCLSWITQERIRTQPLLDPLCDVFDWQNWSDSGIVITVKKWSLSLASSFYSFWLEPSLDLFSNVSEDLFSNVAMDFFSKGNVFLLQLQPAMHLPRSVGRRRRVQTSCFTTKRIDQLPSRPLGG